MSDEIKLTLNPVAEPAAQAAVATAAEEAIQEAEAIAAQVEADAANKQQFTEDEQKMISEFSKQIDVTDSNLVFSYGAAAQQNISITQLKRIFKEQTGTTIITYLTNFRIGEAKRMIQEGNLNFTQIAEAVGYDNIYYFSTLFKKNTGMTLTEYSKSVRR